MSLFFASFDEAVVPLLIDAHDEAEARLMAKGVAEREPLNLKPLPAGIFVAELFTEDEDGNEIVCSPLEEITELLEALDDEDEPRIVAALTCGAEADDESGNVITCSLPPHADGQHQAVTSQGMTVHW